MSTPAFDRHRLNPANWKFRILYFCPEDPHVIVPKRFRWMGWTLNFARPMALPVLAWLLGLLFAAAEFFRSFGDGGDRSQALILLAALGTAGAIYRRWRAR